MQLLFNISKYKFLILLYILIAIRILIIGVGHTEASYSFSSLTNIRRDIYGLYLQILPSPHSELLAGMVLGLDQLDQVPTFNDILLQTGTVHVVVVSGFNIVIFFNFLERIVGSIYKLKNLLIAEIVSLLYAVFTGFEYPVIRAWIMCTMIYLCKYLGIKVSGLYILLLTASVIVLANPFAVLDMSFQLSFLAVLGLMVFTAPIEGKAKSLLKLKRSPFLLKDFTSSLSAQLLVWPLISYKIGTVNIFSPISNAFLLWSVPYATAIGLVISILYKSVISSKVLSLFVYPYLDFFVEGVYAFATILPEQHAFKIDYYHVISYYMLVFFLIRRKSIKV